MTSFIHPFKGLYPKPEYVAQVIAPPYDVVSREQAKEMAANKPYDFLHISHAEIDLPDNIDEHDEQVYQQARENFNKLLQQHILIQDNQDCFYIYQLQQGDRKQTGIMAKANCAAYADKKIRRHELTRPDKVLDRSKHIETLGAQVSPTLLAYKKDPALTNLLKELTKNPPLLEAPLQGVIHRIWRIADNKECGNISDLLNKHDTIYIADGHHRNEAAYQVSLKHPEYSDSLVGIFPEDELVILGYHRVIKKINDPQKFLQDLQKEFNVSEEKTLRAPHEKGEIILYVKNKIYSLKTQSDQLDVDALTEKVLTPLLGIHDIRKDTNIAFVGGQDALQQIKQLVDSGACDAGFVMYPTSMQELLKVADAHEIMPPKSTWFEPKLADGLLSYLINT
jgi:uncharacterized protein (DUF1015 family)